MDKYGTPRFVSHLIYSSSTDYFFLKKTPEHIGFQIWIAKTVFRRSATIFTLRILFQVLWPLRTYTDQ